MLCIGTAYSWSLFTRPLMVCFHWTSLQTSGAFASMIFGIGVGALTGGLLLDRFGARRIGVAGAALWGSGNLLAGLGTAHYGLLWLYLTYGLIGGFGGGMGYVIPGANASRWFPRHRGLVNGFVLFVFGLGSVIYNNVIGALPQFKELLDAAGRAVAVHNAAVKNGTTQVAYGAFNGTAFVMNIFIWSGVIFLIVGIGSALALSTPPIDKAAPDASDTHDFRWRETLRTRAFYIIWLIVFIDCFAGLALLGNAVPIYAELTGLGDASATLTYGWLSIFNGIGRLVWAWLSDSLGRIPALVTAFALQGGAIFALSRLHVPLAVDCAFALLLLCFGGILAIAPALTADYFGTRFLGEDYGCVITAVSLSGLTGPVLFGVLEDATGSLVHAVVPIAALVTVSAFLPLAARRPVARTAHR
jgi:OFA family oxalate/formate antiporter-like MFS transporter